MKLLIVEDEAEIQKNLTITFESQGWQVKATTNIQAFEHILNNKAFNPHVIVLDRNLGGHDSIQLVPKTKAVFADAKILILSALDTASEKAFALDKGADDYVAKPYSSIELIARINALMRRTSLVHSKDVISLGNIVINQKERSVLIEKKALFLAQKEFLLLSLFMCNPGKVFSRDVLLENVWKTNIESDSKVVPATINNLRRKLETSKSSINIKNIRNVGYWIEV